jgi:predicted 3-demethylubiquinone-9 3-methyltransferase (glyoxalase superfamily)
MAKNTICLWYDKDAEEAARFYVETFPTARCMRCTVLPATSRPAKRATC